MAETGKRGKEPKAIPSDEARQALGDLIDRAGFKGERILISRHGKPIVALVSVEDFCQLEGKHLRDVA